MKIALIVIGIGIVVIAALVDATPRVEVPLGYLLVSSSMIIAAALWRGGGEEGQHYQTFQRVYSALADGPLEMEMLIKTMSGKWQSGEWDRVCREALGRMLANRDLVMRDGLVSLPGQGARGTGTTSADPPNRSPE